ncbi:MAG: hypothetical protein ACI89L_001532 [Phycisphaerales bacterium]|jgi:hypothetical protein
MNQSQLRQALAELNGERTLEVALAEVGGSASTITVGSAMLIPEETDKLVKVTDGASVFIIEAERIAWIRIGL